MKHSMASLLICGDSNLSSEAWIGERLHLTMSTCSFQVQSVAFPAEGESLQCRPQKHCRCKLDLDSHRQGELCSTWINWTRNQKPAHAASPRNFSFVPEVDTYKHKTLKSSRIHLHCPVMQLVVNLIKLFNIVCKSLLLKLLQRSTR